MAKIDFTKMKNMRKASEETVTDVIPPELEKSYHDLWGVSAEKITSIDVNRIEPYTDINGNTQPYKLNEEKVAQISASIKEIGIITPLRVRSKDHIYEVIAGHHRLEAAKRLGLLQVPCIIKEYTDDEAFQILTESNIQREKILPSEYARIFAKYMELRNDSDLTAKEIAAKFDLSKESMYRYLNVGELIPELRQMTDDGVINMGAVGYICNMSEEAQNVLYGVLKEIGKKVSAAKGRALKELYVSCNGSLNKDDVVTLFCGLRDPEKKQQPDYISSYFREGTPIEEIHETIKKALDMYFSQNRS